MSFTTVLAPIDASAPSPTPFMAAVRLARRFGAKLDILSYAPPPTPLLSATMISAQAAGDALEAQRQAALEAMTAAAKQAESLGVAYEECLTSSPLVSLEEAVAQRALLADLIVAPPLEDGVRSRRQIAQGALFNSPAPLLIWPPELEAGLADSVGGSILVAWDGRKPASAAARMALPLLRAAGKVTVACVTEEYSEASFEDEPGSEFIVWLSKQGVNAKLLTMSGEDVCAELQHAAKEQSADLIVMGAYGHSQMLESIFGGVTETMLHETTTPLFMAH